MTPIEETIQRLMEPDKNGNVGIPDRNAHFDCFGHPVQRTLDALWKFAEGTSLAARDSKDYCDSAVSEVKRLSAELEDARGERDAYMKSYQDRAKLCDEVTRERDSYKSDLEYISEMDGDYEIWDAVQSARSALGLDSDGKTAPFKAGDRVIFLPENTFGTVEKQTLHYDCNERFWGNLSLKMDDGRRIHCNCWQTRKLDENGDPIEDRASPSGVSKGVIKVPKITRVKGISRKEV